MNDCKTAEMNARREIAELIAVGLLSQPNAAGLTALQAHEIGERVARALRPSSVAVLVEGDFHQSAGKE